MEALAGISFCCPVMAVLPRLLWHSSPIPAVLYCNFFSGQPVVTFLPWLLRLSCPDCPSQLSCPGCLLSILVSQTPALLFPLYYPCCHVLTLQSRCRILDALSNLSCSGRPVLSSLTCPGWLFRPTCPHLSCPDNPAPGTDVLSWLSLCVLSRKWSCPSFLSFCHTLAVLSLCPVQDDLTWMTCLANLSRRSCPCCPILAVMPQLSCPGCHAPSAIPRLSLSCLICLVLTSSGCTVPTVLLNYPVPAACPAFLSPRPQLSYSYCTVGALIRCGAFMYVAPL